MEIVKLCSISACRLGPKTLERHGPFLSQKAVLKTGLFLSPGKPPALRKISWLSVLGPNLSAKLVTCYLSTSTFQK